MPTILVHINNEDPVMGEVDKLPSPTDLLIAVKNPRRRDGKDLPYLEPNVSVVMWPSHRLNFIEVIPSDEEEEIITSIRE